MKILVVSDTHRLETNLEKVLKTEKPNILFHLGDIEGSELKIENMANIDCVMVRGNNDFFSHLKDEREVSINKYKFFLTHGHIYNVSLGVERLRNEARERQVDIAIFGHTHRPYYEKKENLILLNPGSISYPRQAEKCPSYALIDIDDKNFDMDIQIKYLTN